jgi:hypothetical protein
MKLEPAKKICFLVALFILSCSLAGAAAMPGLDLLERVMDRFEFMPEYHLTGDLYGMTNYKNEDYKRRYFVESNADMEFVLVSYRKCLYSSVALYVRTTMGRQDGAIMFDPRELRYGIDPATELRLNTFNMRAGLDHYCFHEIDSWDGNTEYWNKEYLEISSKNNRPMEYRTRLVNQERWDLASRLSWEFKIGHYMEKAFGLLNPVIVGGNHDYDWELTTTERWAFYKRLDWVVNLRVLANVNLSRHGEFRQTYHFGFEGHFRRGPGGMMLFADYIALDELIVRPKDKLVELGIRFYN